MTAPRRAVVATAGHVDAGKSALVRALTGTDPDRLPEERRRGMSLDLGYARTTLDDGTELSLVDVPGHARYVGSALAGLAPAGAVLLVVAADRGWQAQTTEHVDALTALGTSHVVLCVTRADLADPGPTTLAATSRLESALPGAVVETAVSVVRRDRVDVEDVRAALGRCVAQLPAVDPAGDVRLWVDRAFTVQGRGLVVTGTLEAGTVAVGHALEGPEGTEVVVRGVQVGGVPVERVVSPTRVALAVRSSVPLQRGSVLLTRSAWSLTATLDVRLSAPLPPRPRALVECLAHVGTLALPVRVRPLGDDHARLVLDRALPLRVGDRVVLRDPGGHRVLGGGVVLDPSPEPLARRGAAAGRAGLLAEATALDLALERGPQRSVDLLRQGIATDGSTRRHAPVHVGPVVTCACAVAGLADRLSLALQALPVTSPGLSVDAAAALLDVDALLVPLVVDAIGGGITIADGRVPTGRHGLGDAEPAMRRLEGRLAVHPLDAPDRGELREAGLDARALATAVAQGRLLRLTPDVVVHPEALRRALPVLARLPQPFAPGDATRALRASRRVVVPLLEHLDRVGATTRDPDGRRRLAQGARRDGGSTTTVSRRAT